jgi:hypothetical protein
MTAQPARLIFALWLGRRGKPASITRRRDTTVRISESEMLNYESRLNSNVSECCLKLNFGLFLEFKIST